MKITKKSKLQKNQNYKKIKITKKLKINVN